MVHRVQSLSRLTLVALFIFATVGATTLDDPSSQLEALIEEEREFQQEQREEMRERDFPIVSAEREAQDAEKAQDFLEQLREIDRSQLDGDEQVTYDLFERRLESRVVNFEHRSYLTPLNHEGGPHSSFVRLPSRMSFGDVEDYERYLTRLRTSPQYFDQYISLMEEGLETGYTLPSAVLGAHEGMINSYLVDDPTESALYEPFESFPGDIAPEEQERLREEGRQAIAEHAFRALETFRDFLNEEYIPRARDTYGVSDLPNGREYYDFLVRYHTTLDLTAEEIHQIGVAEVERIRGEMEAIIQDVGFDGDFDEFLEFLRTDPQFYAETPEELLKEAAYISKKADGRLPSVFHLETLPRRPYGVEPVPEDLAPHYTGGRYSVGSSDQEAGFYWVNTYDLPSRPLYVLPALTLHEAVPGHHLQIALAQEDETRRRGGVTAFSEGWALYAEYLGSEMGIYEDPYEDFGRLTYEMWRACRLVVDTGVHALGWTRDEVREFLAANTALSHHETRTETDRYIAVPGQALAYKMGELTIRDLRDEAAEALGDDFDVRDFHHVVLENGPVPLVVLEDNVRSWIQSQLEEQTEV